MSIVYVIPCAGEKLERQDRLRMVAGIDVDLMHRGEELPHQHRPLAVILPDLP